VIFSRGTAHHLSGFRGKTRIKYINIFKYREKFEISLDISGKFCPVIASTGAVPMLYQLPFSFLACKSSLPQDMENYFTVPTWKKF
jgi:hypothetical protein